MCFFFFKVDFDHLEADGFKVESDGLLSWNTGVTWLRSRLKLSFILLHWVLLKIAKIKCCMKNEQILSQPISQTYPSG